MFEEIYGDMVSIDELCEMLTIGKNTAYNLLKTNQIKAFKIGRIWKIPRESVSEYVLLKSKSPYHQIREISFYKLFIKIFWMLNCLIRKLSL